MKKNPHVLQIDWRRATDNSPKKSLIFLFSAINNYLTHKNILYTRFKYFFLNFYLNFGLKIKQIVIASAHARMPR